MIEPDVVFNSDSRTMFGALLGISERFSVDTVMEPDTVVKAIVAGVCAHEVSVEGISMLISMFPDMVFIAIGPDRR